METVSKICQNCKKPFEIDPDDFAFYEKIQVPPPTWCPECRMIRRMAFWNERSFFKRIDSSGKTILSTYPEESPYKIIDRDEWWSDKFDPLKYGRDYDFSRPFFEQIRELSFTVPFPSRAVNNSMVNSDYSNASADLKNCYMCFNCVGGEDCLYAVFCEGARDSIDILNTGAVESCYEIMTASKNNQVFFGARLSDNLESYFLYNCGGLTNCFGCVNLMKKKYHIWNEPYTKEEYFKKLEEFNLGSYSSLQKLHEEFKKFLLKFPQKYMHGKDSEKATGEDVGWSRNAKLCFEAYKLENVAYSQQLAGGTKDSYDYTSWGYGELMYEATESGGGANNVKFGYFCFSGAQNLEYSINCFSSTDCFGCVGLKKAKYCIFNKQYSKEEYFALKEKIIEHMRAMPYKDSLGRTYSYGEFFPPDMAPFAANETALMDFTEMTKDQALAFGLSWRDSKPNEYKITISAENLPDHIRDVNESVTKEVIGCLNCKKAYRIVPKELEFYKRFSLPLPRLCPNCRFKERIKYRLYPKWYDGKCDCGGRGSSNGVYRNIAEHFHGVTNCSNKFITAYKPDKPQIVYCADCFKSEMV